MSRKGKRARKLKRQADKTMAIINRQRIDLSLSKDWSSYDHRDAVVRSLGFQSYSDYLNSPLWASIRVKVFAQKGKRCSLCPAGASMVHHNDYTEANLKGENLTDLYPICRKCHEGFEFHNGKKLSPAQVFRRFDEFRAAVRVNVPVKKKGKKGGNGSKFEYRKPTGPIPPSLMPQTDGRFARITMPLLLAISTAGIGWNRHQIAALGLKYPLKHGWKKEFAGAGKVILLSDWEIAVANRKIFP